jgi:hypothetical protein
MDSNNNVNVNGGLGDPFGDGPNGETSLSPGDAFNTLSVISGGTVEGGGSWLFGGHFHFRITTGVPHVGRSPAPPAASGFVDLPGFNLMRPYPAGTSAYDSLNIDGSVTETVATFSEGVQDATSDLMNAASLLSLPRDALLVGAAMFDAAADATALARSITFDTEHAAAHFADSTLSQTEIETQIRGELQTQFGTTTNTTVMGPFTGRTTFRGTIIEYRGYGFTDGSINVGTYYPPGP